MKQHITAEQLNELSEKGKKKLRKWSQNLDSSFDLTEDNDNGLPLLSIGQMIEFLQQHHLKTDPMNMTITYSSSLLSWWFKDEKQYRELCDALWEAVKEVLEKK